MGIPPVTIKIEITYNVIQFGGAIYGHTKPLKIAPMVTMCRGYTYIFKNFLNLSQFIRILQGSMCFKLSITQ